MRLVTAVRNAETGEFDYPASLETLDHEASPNHPAGLSAPSQKHPWGANRAVCSYRRVGLKQGKAGKRK